MVDKKVDLAISTFGMPISWAKVVDILVTNEDVALGQIYLKNPRDTYDWTVFFQPLKRWAWIGIIIFSVVIPLLIATIVFFRKYK